MLEESEIVAKELISLPIAYKHTFSSIEEIQTVTDVNRHVDWKVCCF